MRRIAYVDGGFVPLGDAAVSIEDRGMQFADGVYEVCAVLGGRLLDWPLHLERLRRNLAALFIDPPMSEAALGIVVRRLIAANGLAEALLYIQVTRGVARRDHGFPSVRPPTLVMTVRSFDFAQRIGQQRSGVDVVTINDQRWGRCDIKTTGLLANVLAKQDARNAGVFEAWLVGPDGTILEGASTNAWIVDAAGKIITHPLSARILPGIMRGAVIEAARTLAIPVIEGPFLIDDARSAAEAFVTSTTAPVVPVVRVDNHAIGNGTPGAVTERLASAIWQRIADQTGWHPPQ